MAKDDGSLRSYAEALAGLGAADGTTESLDAELAQVLDLLTQHPEIDRFVADPAVLRQGKANAVEELLQDKIRPALLHFLLILVHENQWRNLRELAAAFHALVAERQRKVAGELTVAVPLSDEQLGAVREALAACLNKDVHLVVRVDPRILGGFKVQVQDFVFDGTVDRFLEAVRLQLLGGASTA